MRSLPADLAAEIQKSMVQPALLATFEFDASPLYMWSGYGDLVYDGKTFIGGGNLVGVSPYAETQDLQALGLGFQITGIPSSLLSVALAEPYQGRGCKLYFAAVSSTGRFELEAGDGFLQLESGGYLALENNLVSEPYQLFSGVMDVMEIADDANTATITVNAESRLIRLKTPRVRRYSAEDQKSRYPNDKGLDFLTQIQDKELTWQSRR